MYYDQHDNLRAVGAEAALQSTKQEAYVQEWKYVKWFVPKPHSTLLAKSRSPDIDARFKLHLRPSSILPGAALPPIEVNKTTVEILADFLAYIYKYTIEFISETNPTGRQILEMPSSNGPPIDFVLSHPNGWTGLQQNNMRRAAVLARLVPVGDQGLSRLQFVTEGEASLQFCIATGLGNNVIKVGCYMYAVGIH